MSSAVRPSETKKMTSPKLRFKEFHDDWKIEQLSNLLEFKNGVNADKEQYGRGIKFINVLDILSNDFLTYDLIIGSVDIDEATFEKYLVSFGDILFQRSSETREEVGTACVYLDERPATFGGFVIRGKKIGDYNPIFFNKLLKTDLARNAITSKSGGSTRYNVGQETLSSIRLPFPSLPEQQKIASFLSAVDEKIQQLTHKKELLEQYKKGVMQQLFRQNYDSYDAHDSPDSKSNQGNQKNHTKSQFRQLRFKDENGKPYPKWEEKKLGDVIKLQGGFAFKSELFRTQGIPVIRISNISNENNFIDLNNVVYYEEIQNPENFTIKNGDLLVAMSGATTGKSSIYNLPYKAYLNQRVGLFRSLNPSLLCYEFLIQFVFSEGFKKQLDSVLVAGAQPNVSGSDIESFKFVLPSIEEQQKIASYLTALDAKIESVATQIAHTQTFKKGLLQQMFV